MIFNLSSKWGWFARPQWIFGELSNFRSNQKRHIVTAGPNSRNDDDLAEAIVAGGYWLRDPGPDAELAIAYCGAVAPEALAAHQAMGPYQLGGQAMPTAPAAASISQPLVAPRRSIVVLPFANLSNDPDQ